MSTKATAERHDDRITPGRLPGETARPAGFPAGTAAAVLGIVATNHGWPWPLAIAACILTGTFIGTCIGLLVSRLGIPSFVVTLADGSIPIRGTYKLDPTRDPKTVDWTDTIGEDAGKTLLAIYSLEGDRLVFCAAYPGQERPTEFRTRPGQVLRVSQREMP